MNKELVLAACGFAFTPDLSKVLLQLKNRPAFCAGKLNGPGGKHDTNSDLTLVDTMSREFFEETGITNSTTDWNRFHIEKNQVGGMCVHFFTTNSLDITKARTETDEPIVLVDCRPSNAWFADKPELHWCLPPNEVAVRPDIANFYTVAYRGYAFSHHCSMYNLSYLIPMAKAWIQFPDLRYSL